MSSPSLLTEESPSVQAHLQIMQGVISRMADNSTASKAWCITIVSAILVLVADKSKPEYAFIALVPIFLFLALDSYYLALEKAFRDSYNEFIGRLHSQMVGSEDLYSVVPRGNMTKHQIDALKSFSVWGFYVCLGVMVYLAKELVL
ncbi:hypothetical protein [Idiomarina abyssalis]|jgi:hypothetical protein|uniref:hypothetical protein n=1 Tax=Idiomarina abyssalis TaxID=86102 RepID=UPI00241D082E|nr:hypothetical protein [Idiomarina abyssalis]|tara:strand:- start:1813 stop:2250 length:438 start_codon:yes stop_codon:yes gene_type:complete